jgi:hypothetical protein
MRWDEQGWTRYGPAIMHDMRAASTRAATSSRTRRRVAQASTNDPAMRVLATGVVPPRRPGGTNDRNLAPMRQRREQQPG